MKVADNRKQLKRHIKRSIADNGFAILSVNPPSTPFGAPVNYSYTVGLSHRGLPELFICGPIPNNVMGAILKNQAVALLKEGVISTKVRTDIVKSSEPVKAMRSHVRELFVDIALRDFCVELRQRAGKNLKIFQVCYPDGNNLLPGEEGYDTRYRQDLIAVVPPVEERPVFMSDVLGGRG